MLSQLKAIIIAITLSTSLTYAQTHKQDSIIASHYWVPYTLDVADDFNAWVTMRAGIAQTLFKLDQYGNARMQLVQTSEFLDSKTVRLVLLDNIYFSNGKKLDAQAVKSCLERTFKLNLRAREYFEFDEIKAHAQELIIKLKKENYVIFNSLCEPLFAIIDVTYDEDNIDNNPIGTGPYAISEYQAGNYIKLNKNPYYPHAIAIEQAILYQEADSDARALSLQNGSKNYTANLNHIAVNMFKHNTNFTVLSTISPRNNVVYLNFNNEFLQNKALRQAMALSIDKNAIVKAIAGQASPSLIPTMFAYANTIDEAYPYNLKQALALLEANNIKDTNNDGIRELNGKNIELNYYIQSDHGSFDSRIIASALEHSFKNLGIKINIILAENLMAKAASGDFDLLSANDSTAPVGDVSDFLAMRYLKAGKANYGHYFNAQAESMITKLKHLASKEQRDTLSVEIAKILAEDVAAFYINFAPNNVVLNNQLKKDYLSPFDYYFIDESLHF